MSGRAQSSTAPATGMLTATGPAASVAAVVVSPTTGTTPSAGAEPVGLTSGIGPATDSALLPDTAGASTDSGAALTGAYGDKNAVVDIGSSRRFRYGVHLTVIETYDDNIFLTENSKEEDFYTVVQPGITLGVGDVRAHQENYLQLDYTAGIFLFADHSDNDSVQHLISLEGQYRFSKLTLSLSQQVQILDGADLTGADLSGNNFNRVNLDTNGQSELNVYTTRLKANYLLTEKTSIDLGALYSLSDYSTLLDSEVASGDLYVNYALSPKLTVGVGVAGGYVFAETPTPDQSFEQLNLRMNYVATGKLTFTGSGGVEFRQSDGRDGTAVTPVFDLGLVYLPFDSTSVRFSAARQVLVSAVLGGQDYQSSTVTVGVQQRFFQRLYLGLSTGYENSHYVSVLDRVNATRDDDYYFVQVGLDVNIREHFTAGVSYQHRENFSSGQFNGDFDDNQVSLRLSVNF